MIIKVTRYCGKFAGRNYALFKSLVRGQWLNYSNRQNRGIVRTPANMKNGGLCNHSQRLKAVCYYNKAPTLTCFRGSWLRFCTFWQIPISILMLHFFPNRKLHIQSQNKVWKLFKVNNKDVHLVSLLLTLNIFSHVFLLFLW